MDQGYNRMMFATIIVISMNIIYLYFSVKYNMENEQLGRKMYEIQKEKENKLEIGCLFRSYNETLHGKCPFHPLNYGYWPNIPHLCTLTSKSCSSANHFLGQTENLAASWSDIIFFDFFLLKNSDVRNFIEFHTGSGVQSLYFGMISNLRNGRFLSFDKEDERIEKVKNAWLTSMVFEKMEKSLQEDTFQLKKPVFIFNQFSCEMLTKIIPKMKNKKFFMFIPRSENVFQCLPKSQYELKYETFGKYFGSSFHILKKKN
jgi:hypothetical protein